MSLKPSSCLSLLKPYYCLYTCLPLSVFFLRYIVCMCVFVCILVGLLVCWLVCGGVCVPCSRSCSRPLLVFFVASIFPSLSFFYVFFHPLFTLSMTTISWLATWQRPVLFGISTPNPQSPPAPTSFPHAIIALPCLHRPPLHKRPPSPTPSPVHCSCLSPSIHPPS